MKNVNNFQKEKFSLRVHLLAFFQFQPGVAYIKLLLKKTACILADSFLSNKLFSKYVRLVYSRLDFQYFSNHSVISLNKTIFFNALLSKIH